MIIRVLWLGPMTHDYRRNGTLARFATMNLATGEVLHDTRRRHAGEDVWRSSNRSTWLCPEISNAMSCWTTSQYTRANRIANGSIIGTVNVGICTSPPPRRRG